MKILFYLFCFNILFLNVAHADEFNFSWDAVTVDVGGSPLTESPSYKLYISTSPLKDRWPTQEIPESPTNTTSKAITRTALGTYYAVVTATTSKGESAPSNEVQFVITPKIPLAPTNLKIGN